MSRRRLLPILALLVCSAGPAAHAQDSASAPAGRYTAEQADRGQTVFRRICAQCHVVAQFSGAPFRITWNGRPASDLFEQIRTTMPNDNPGSLPRQQYADVIAYIMKLNGALPGAAELPVDADALRHILIIPATDPRD